MGQCDSDRVVQLYVVWDSVIVIELYSCVGPCDSDDVVNQHQAIFLVLLLGENKFLCQIMYFWLCDSK